MPVHAQAAILRLDGLADRGEYNQFLHLMDRPDLLDVHQIVAHLRQGDRDEQALAQRSRTSGCRPGRSGRVRTPRPPRSSRRRPAHRSRPERLPRPARAACGEPRPRRAALAAAREPHADAIVIDEAHNICSASSGAIEAALVARLVQIAAEDGHGPPAPTQRPSKIHPQVLSQCDNLVLMRMNSPGDLAELGTVFGFAPPAMLRSSPFFVQGEALVAGGFVPTPAVVRTGRLTVEGGSDVAVPVSVPVSVLAAQTDDPDDPDVPRQPGQAEARSARRCAADPHPRPQRASAPAWPTRHRHARQVEQRLQPADHPVPGTEGQSQRHVARRGHRRHRDEHAGQAAHLADEDSTPAAAAITATTKDHRSGE